jgi:hypothetical protein
MRDTPPLAAVHSRCLCCCVQAKKFMETGKTAMGLIAAASVAMGMRYVSHFTIYGDLYEYGI